MEAGELRPGMEENVELRYRNIMETYKLVKHEYGGSHRGFWMGTSPRVLLFMPMTAIQWSAYELFKRVLCYKQYQ